MDRWDRLLEPGCLMQGALVRTLLHERLPLRELAAGELVGRFRIVEELGRGGMGIVYLATRADGEYEQEVAIKWLPSGALDAVQLDQFRRERQILAQLRHPHIARLLDGGHGDDGHLWFAMERVDGPHVDVYAAHMGLAWAERVRLLLPVIEAVQFAHGRLLVHRDIKPGNVLVDSDGRAKLLDFGVAALLSDEQARAAFTPGFASPEQLAGARPDVASDVWQLGRLLEVVLAAGAPARRVPRDLAAVLAKATEAQPLRRYLTVAALHADLQRVLRYRPVAARRANVWHRSHLLLQAHPFGVLASAVALLAFLGVVAGFMLRLAYQRDQAEHARVVAESINAFLTDDLLPGADPFQGGSSDVAASTLIERSLDRVEQRLHAAPDVAAQLEISLGKALANLGHMERAHAAVEHAAQRLTALHGPRHRRVLWARLLSEVYQPDLGALDASEQRLQALRRDADVALGDDAELAADIDNQLARIAYLRDDFSLCAQRYDTVLTRAAAMPADSLADAYFGISICETRLGRLEPALAHARQARALREQEHGAQHPLTLESGIAIESALVGLGRYDEAIVELRALRGDLSRRYGDAHPTTLMITHDLGFALTCAGRVLEAEPLLRTAADARGKLLGTDHPWYALSEAVLAMALIQHGQLPEADAALGRAEAALALHPHAMPYVHVVVLENRADLLLAEGRDAASAYDAALAEAGALYPAEHPRLDVLRLGLGLALLHAGDVAAGKPLLGASLQRLGERPDCRAHQIADAREQLAQLR